MSTSYTPGSYPATEVLPADQRHLVSRFSYGVTPALAAEVRAAGGASAWFDRQLAVEPADVADWWPDLHRSPASLWQRQANGTRGGWEVMEDYVRRLIARRILSSQQVLEVMTEFWENHLHVPAVGDGQFPWRAPYGDLIRRHALGRFDQMLAATTVHPAMTIFLSNYASTKAHPDENLGRELLELHTVGVGHYGEADVKSSGRILTGFHVDMWNTFRASYRPEDHWTGAVKVMGFRSPNRHADGRPVVRAYLHYLAHHPATAHHLATKLATKFVSDTPSTGLVATLAKTYLDHGTRIVPVLKALVASPEFAAAAGAKLRDPGEDVVATMRVVGAKLAKPVDDDSAANALIWTAQSVGLAPMTWPRPDGAPLDSTSWATASRAMGSASAHWNAAGGWWPSKQVTYRAAADWVPELPIAFRDLVDHLCRTLLHRPSTPTLLQACCVAAGMDPAATVTASSAVVRWSMPRVLGALLDSPEHYTR